MAATTVAAVAEVEPMGPMSSGAVPLNEASAQQKQKGSRTGPGRFLLWNDNKMHSVQFGTSAGLRRCLGMVAERKDWGSR